MANDNAPIFFTRNGRMYMNLFGKPVPRERRYPACKHSWDRSYLDEEHDVEYLHCYGCGWTFLERFDGKRRVRLPKDAGHWEADKVTRTLTDGTEFPAYEHRFVLDK